jgi:hypothetical protein
MLRFRKSRFPNQNTIKKKHNLRNTPSPNIKAAADQSRAAIKIQDRQVQQKEEKEASSTLVESPVPIFHGDLGARLPPLCPPHAAAWRNHPGLRGGEAGGGSGKEVARIRQVTRRSSFPFSGSV